MPPEEGAGDTRGFLDAGLVSSDVFPFLAELAGRFLVLADKNKITVFKKYTLTWNKGSVKFTHKLSPLVIAVKRSV